MTYQALARKWRPKNFAEVIGQSAVVQTLSNAFNQNRLHHAYLLTGTRGVGKTTLGRIIAKCLNCEIGITATPCGQCNTCQEIGQGNFVDLFEIDAASRTKVEDTHELLNNVPYAPTRGRYKIYLIDEVHMLSNHSFNALLKTLEEPPEHVKFILATTDPQKLPITILSRCLQFHLRNLLPDEIAKHMQTVLAQENISYETIALQRLARAAEGSMRDGLSLLDQAIAFCNNTITEQAIYQMLGITDVSYLFEILDALAAQNAGKLVQISQQLNEQGIDYHHVLTEFISLLHELAWTQQYPALTDDEAIQSQAKKMTKEDIQLFYQIALIGKRDLPLAPTAQIGFEMILLRMLTFAPMHPVIPAKADTQAGTPNSVTAIPTQNIPSPVMPAKADTQAVIPNSVTAIPTQNIPSHVMPAKAGIQAETTNSVAAKQPIAQPKTVDWNSLCQILNLTGLTKILAANCVIKSIINDRWTLWLDQNQSPLLNSTQEQRLQKIVSDHFGKPIHLRIEITKEAIPTLAREQEQQKAAHHHAAVAAITQDQNVQDILKSFNANIDLTSITAIHQEEK
jgi:DNA polymerase-3 subunit gamma/tau